MRKISWLAIFCFSLFVLFTPGWAAEAQEEEVCVTCHEMFKGDMPNLYHPVELWRQSSHKVQGVTCTGCHGGNPKDEAESMSTPDFIGKPSASTIPFMCGKCHTDIREEYLSGVHSFTSGSRRPTCITCHNSHNIQPPILENIIEHQCVSCHKAEEITYFQSFILSVNQDAEKGNEELKMLHHHWVDISIYQKILNAWKNSTRVKLIHLSELDKVKSETEKISASLKEIHQKYEIILRNEALKKKTGKFTIAFLLLSAVALHFYYREVEKSRKR